MVWQSLAVVDAYMLVCFCSSFDALTATSRVTFIMRLLNALCVVRLLLLAIVYGRQRSQRHCHHQCVNCLYICKTKLPLACRHNSRM